MKIDDKFYKHLGNNKTLTNFMEQNNSLEAGSFPASREIPNMLWAWRFITVFTKACHWSVSLSRWTQFTRTCPVSLKSVLILSSHLRHGFPCGLFPLVFSPPKPCINFSSLPHVWHALLIPFVWYFAHSVYCDIPHYISFEASFSSPVLDPNFSPTPCCLNCALTSL